MLLCEHASPQIPTKYRFLFPDLEIAKSHRGYDLGAHGLSQGLKASLGGHLFAGKVSRLMIDLNRSLNSPQLFSTYSRRLGSEEKKILIQKYYKPYRDRCLAHIEKALKKNRPIVLLAIHSFTPSLKGKTRETSVGLLYRPQKIREARLARHLRSELQGSCPKLRVDFNRPYRGYTDAHLNDVVDYFNSDLIHPLFIEVRQDILKSLQKTVSLQRGFERALVNYSTSLGAGSTRRSRTL